MAQGRRSLAQYIFHGEFRMRRNEKEQAKAVDLSASLFFYPLANNIIGRISNFGCYTGWPPPSAALDKNHKVSVSPLHFISFFFLPPPLFLHSGVIKGRWLGGCVAQWCGILKQNKNQFGGNVIKINVTHYSGRARHPLATPTTTTIHRRRRKRIVHHH